MRTYRVFFISILWLIYFHVHVTSQSLDWNGPVPQGNDLRCVRFADYSTGYAVGDFGTILKTDDGGAHWNILAWEDLNTDYNNFIHLYSVSVIDANTVVAVGGDGKGNGVIIKSVDGGLHWNDYSNNLDASLHSVFFIDQFMGYAVGGAYGQTAVFLKTTDGGISWIKQTHGDWNMVLSVFFTDENTGYVTGDGKIYKTTDGGNNWAEKYYTPGDIYSIYFANHDTGYAVGENGSYGIILKTTNGGEQWTAIVQGTEIYGYLLSVYFLDSFTGFASGGDGLIYKTLDGGDAWISFQGEKGHEISSICMTDENSITAVGEDGIIYSTSVGGEAWSYANWYKNVRDLNAVCFPDDLTGYAAGVNWTFDRSTSEGVVLKTTDGGANWEPQSTGIPENLSDIFFKDQNTGLAVGDNGTIIKTSDGGIHWQTVNSGTDQDLFSVFFADNEIGYIAGSIGTLLKTTDGGDSWNSLNPGISEGLYSVFFTDKNTGYAVGGDYTGNAVILKTTDGGDNWALQYSEEGKSRLLSAYFLDENSGYAVSENGMILKTINGGTEWIELDRVIFYGGLNSIFFTSMSTGFAIGWDNYAAIMLKTVNGGEDWEELYLGMEYSQNSICFSNSVTGYIVGSGFYNGMILKLNLPGGLGISESNPMTSMMTIYPNPSNDQISVITENEILELEILDQFGKILFKKSIGNNSIKMDVSNYNRGIYFVRAKSKEGISVQKLVIY